MDDETLYGTFENPIGHRFGNLTSRSLIFNERTRAVTGVLFQCDCGRYRTVEVRWLRHAPCPTLCKRCEKRTGVLPPKPVRLSKQQKESPDTRSYPQRFPKEYQIWCSTKNIRGRWNRHWKNSFHRFIDTVGLCPSGKCLCRYDRTKPHGPGNSYWGWLGQDSIKYPLIVNGESVTANVLRLRYGIRSRFVYEWKRRGLTGDEIVSKWHELNGTQMACGGCYVDGWYDIPGSNQRYQVNPKYNAVKAGQRRMSPQPDGNGGWVYTLLFDIVGDVYWSIETILSKTFPNGIPEAPCPDCEEKAVPPTQPEPVVPPVQDNPTVDAVPVESPAVVEPTTPEGKSDGSVGQSVDKPTVTEAVSGTDSPVQVGVVGDSQPAVEVTPVVPVETVREPETGSFVEATAEVIQTAELTVEPVVYPAVERPAIETPPETAPVASESTITTPVDVPIVPAETPVVEASTAPETPVVESAVVDAPVSAAEVVPETPPVALTATVVPPPETKQMTVEESSAAVKALIREGKTIRQISELYGVSYDAIKKLAEMP